MLLGLGEDGAEVFDARVDAVTHLAAVGGLVGAGENRCVVALANLLHTGLKCLTLLQEKESQNERILSNVSLKVQVAYYACILDST